MIDQIVCPHSPNFPRNSEADLVELADGRLLLAWTQFLGGFGDHDAARISAKTSGDGGVTWGVPYVLQRNVGGRNAMSVSFVRLHDGPLLFFFLVKNSLSDCQVWVRRSADEGQTWSEPAPVSSRAGYHVMNNARPIQLAGGRLLAPVALTSDIEAGPHSRVFCYLSDDDGASWRAGTGDTGFADSPAQEPGLVELIGGDVLMIVRTRLGYIFTSRSGDGGETWDEPSASALVSPASPASIARVPGTERLLIVWNNNPDGATARWQDRTPLTAAVSPDEGVTWGSVKDIEADPRFAYAYTSITFVEDDVCFTYYVWNRESGRKPFEATSLKFRRLPTEWFLA
jgi:sialidase-1